MQSGTAAKALARDTVVGIVGAGAMGAGIAQVAAAAGHPVRLYDTRAGAALAAVESVGATFDKLAAKGHLSNEQASQVRERLQPIDALGGLTGCGLVVEAIVENLEAKRSLFRDLESVVNRSAFLATNTSSLSITAIGSALQHPERLAGMHFFNPAPLMPLVEIISGAATAPATAATLRATADAWGKIPVRARSTPGFIVNRVARPFYAESLRVLNEGGADPATLDAILRDAGGFRMGPFELMDMIGHDVNYAVTRSVFDAFYGDSRFTPSALQRELIEAGFLGRKTGRGFYRYGDGIAPPRPVVLTSEAAVGPVRLHGANGIGNILAAKLSDSTISFEQAEAHADGRIVTMSGCVLYVSDGRTATARSAALGEPNLVLLDLALDYSTAKRLALTAAEQASATALPSAAALLNAAGYAVSSLSDVPGMAVLRTVAMLANEAADAVNQGVCSAADCDLAMRKGVNYPRGPLEWADALGLDFVVTVLENLQAAYGEDRYRVSPLLRRKALAGTRFFSQHGEAQ